jgi:AP-1 complex subunit mu
MSAVEKFPVLLSEAEEESSAVPPCFSHEGINVCLPQHRNMTNLAHTTSTFTSVTTTSTSSP